MRFLLLCFAFLGTGSLLAADPVKPAGEGWIELLKQGDETIWTSVHKGWVYAADAELDAANPKKLKPKEPGHGPAWINGGGQLPNLITKAEYVDVEVHVEFLLGTNSNSGIKFQGLYEIQLRDTAATKQADLTGDDCGGIYPKAEDLPRYRHLDKGIPPKVNAAKPAGEWQTLVASFRSPRFDMAGRKTENAKVVKAMLNGKLIHENQELQHPTGSNHVKPEKPKGPFLLQTDHGPTAFRNVWIRELKL